MATPGKLARPPIQEALVDFRTRRINPMDSEGLMSGLQSSMKDQFVRFEVRKRWEAKIETVAGHAPSATATDHGFHGVFATSLDGSAIAQFRVDGFTFNCLGNYSSAEDLFDNSIRAWREFVAIAPPDCVTRIGLRYINRMTLDYAFGDPFERFLTAPATMPPGVPQDVPEFLVRTAVVERETDLSAVVTQRLESMPTESSGTPFVLDVDVFQVRDLAPDTDAIRGVLRRMRELKNRLFFAFMTDAALEKYR